MSVAAPAAPGRGPVEPRGTLRHRLAERGIDRQLWFLVPGLVFLLALFVFPFINGLISAFTLAPAGLAGPIPGTPLADQGNYFWSNFTEFFTYTAGGNAVYRDSIFTTLLLAIPVSLFNTLLAVPLAYRMRGAFRHKRLLTMLLAVPLTLGPLFIAYGIITYLGGGGWLSHVLAALHIAPISWDLTRINSTLAVAISLVLSGFPYAFLLVLSYISGIDPNLEQAAATLGASSWQRFWHITAPLLAPGLAITFCLAFVFSFSVFPSAIMLGGVGFLHTNVIAVQIYDTIVTGNGDFHFANAISMIMATVELLVIGLVLMARSWMYRGTTTGGKG